MGLLAQLFGGARSLGIHGERPLAELGRGLGLKSQGFRRLAVAYLLTYCRDAYGRIADSDWDGAIALYETGERQIPGGSARDPAFSTIRTVFSYNALVCKILRDGLTPEHMSALLKRLDPPRGLFGSQPTPLPDPIWIAAQLLAGSLLHDAGEYEDALPHYAAIASPLSEFGREAASRLRSAANRLELPYGHFVPGVFRLQIAHAAKSDEYSATVHAPSRFVVDRAVGGELIPRLDFSTLQQGMAFEERCVALLRSIGFATQTTEKTGDGGIDVLCYSNHPLLSGLVVVQCKDWRSPVGEPVLRDLYGVVSARHAMKGICITSGSFTEQARAFSRGLPLELVDGAALAYWTLQAMQTDTESVVSDVAPALDNE